ncbi:MAG: enoyl-CoA hydratase-related protein [Mycobacterium sp.]
MTQETTLPEELVTRDVSDGVAVLTWNRPERNNAWSVDMEAVYYRLLQECADDDEVRVIVVTGAGKSFCPGMDAAVLSGVANGGPSTDPHSRPPMTFPRSIPKPIIAAINGACACLGLIAALDCDLRFVSATAKLSTSFAKRGIMAEHGIAWSLPRLIGAGKAMDLLLSARTIMAHEALELGLVDRVFEPGELMDKTLEYARDMVANCSPLALGIIKRQVYEAEEGSHEMARTLAIRYWYDTVRDHPDFKEGMASFLEKRAPHFAPWDQGTTTNPAPLPID